MDEQRFSQSGERPSERLDQSCADYDALLTARFDGETSAEQAARADAHLVACARCESLWRAWSQSRSLLQKLPSPPAPPFLMARILTVCRIASMRSEKVMEESWTIDATMLPAPAPPSFLKDEILRRTVGAGDSISAAREAILVGQTTSAPSLHTGFAFWENTRRALAATALPAAALLVIVFSQRAPEPLSSPTKQYSRAAQTKVQSTNQEQRVPQNVVATTPKTVVFAPRAANFVAPPKTEAPKLQVPVFAPAARIIFARGKIAVAPLPKFEPISFPTPKSNQNSRRLAAKKAAESTAPRVSTPSLATPAIWRIAISETNAEPIQSVLPIVAKVTIPPSQLRATLIAENSQSSDEDEVLDLVSRARDNRPDDVRETMDDFRALLASDSWDDK